MAKLSLKGNIRSDKVFLAKFQMITATVAFGTIGIFRRYIDLPSSVLAMARGFIGALFLILVLLLRKKPIDKAGIRKNGFKLALTGALIGLNWVALFEAYNFTSVAKATVYYYTAPIFLIIASLIILAENLKLKKIVCVFLALIGTVMVSGILDKSESTEFDSTGLILGLAAALMYASVMFINKSITGINATEKTLIQLFMAGLVMLLYSLFTGAFSGIELTTTSIILTVIVGIFHTGFCYTLFFGAMDHLSAQSIAIFTYIDPAVAVILSALILHEHLGIEGIIGAALVIGSALISELK